MPSSIRLGCRVNALVEKFQPLIPGKRRRVRERFSGTVIKSIADKVWCVFWDDIGKCANHLTGSLKFQQAGGSGTNYFANINIPIVLAEHNIGDQRGIDCFLFGGSNLNSSPPPLQQCKHSAPFAQPLT